MLRFLGYLFTAGFIVFLGIAGSATFIIWDMSKDLPDYKQLAQYEPAVMTRIHASDGSMLAEYAKERRLFLPIDAVPKRVIHAFLSAEDKTFYEHAGLDWRGIGAAVLRYAESKVTGKGTIVGASTITQQVAKVFLLTSERTMDRKIKEAILTQRIERAFTKNQILELYLNEIFLGLNSYGVAAASLNYFGKQLNELSLEEIAYIAALPKAPNNYHPFKFTERAIERRNWVLGQMFANGFISEEEMKTAQSKPLVVNPRPFGAQLFAAESFAEEVRREIVGMYNEDMLMAGGLSVRTTLEPKLQIFARQALARGLIQFDRKRGWRGPSAVLEDGIEWGAALAKIKVPADLTPWRLAAVLEVADTQATIGLQPALTASGAMDAMRETGAIPLEYLKWARAYKDGLNTGKEPKKPEDVLKVGDIVYVAPDKIEGQWHLVQMPDVEGAMVVMDPHTGRVLALVGGFSYGKSQFNRAVQALRQPGSSFKPFVYAAALDNGYTPSSVVMDAPVEFRMPNGQVWRPKNYGGKFYGPSTLRRGIEQSRNAMTVRLANDLGMIKVASIAERLGIYDKMPKQLALSLGAGETTLLRMTAAYSMLANGGKKIDATLIDRIQDRYGITVYKHDKRGCETCQAKAWNAQEEPEFADVREQVVSPYTAYQITSMLEGVVERGTGKRMKILGKPVAGKTGTSNDERDAWFIGYTPDLAVGVYVGYDNPKPMGKGRTGGELAAPIVADFMRMALRDKAATPFRVPRGIELIPISVKSGRRDLFGADGVILEAFKPGDEPPENGRVIGDKVAVAGSGTGDGKVLVRAVKSVPKAPALKKAQPKAEDGGGFY